MEPSTLLGISLGLSHLLAILAGGGLAVRARSRWEAPLVGLVFAYGLAGWRSRAFRVGML